MHLLELFSGTGSIGRAFVELGWQVTSVDMDPKSNPTICADIMAFEPPEGVSYDAIWASPPCTEFSRALTTRVRDLAAGLRIARRTLQLIHQLQPKVWFVENPATGLLPQQFEFAGLPCKIVSYCKYGFPYRKLTWIATNCDTWDPIPPCSRTLRCPHMLGNRHPESAQRGPSRLKDGSLHGGRCSQAQLFSIPPLLCKEIAIAATIKVSPPWLTLPEVLSSSCTERPPHTNASM